METSSWRDFLKQIISDGRAKENIAQQMGISPITLVRWSAGESKPREQNLQQLLKALSQQQRSHFAKLLELEYKNISTDLEIGDLPNGIEYKFIMQIFETRATTSSKLLFWTLCGKILHHALRRLDPERMGMAITVLQCMPPKSDGKIHSLRESIGLGTPPWSRNIEGQLMFLGTESLTGSVVTHCHPQIVDDSSSNNIFRPVYQNEHEISMAAYPIMYANRIAGCLLFSSTQVNYFRSLARISLLYDYAQLIALAFSPEQFYAPEQIMLHMMPPANAQQKLFSTLQSRVINLMRDTFNTQHPLTRSEAEAIIWQQLEDELMYMQLEILRNRPEEG